jgi:hypothetical protein
MTHQREDDVMNYGLQQSQVNKNWLRNFFLQFTYNNFFVTPGKNPASTFETTNSIYMDQRMQCFCLDSSSSTLNLINLNERLTELAGYCFRHTLYAIRNNAHPPYHITAHHTECTNKHLSDEQNQLCFQGMVIYSSITNTQIVILALASRTNNWQ